MHAFIILLYLEASARVRRRGQVSEKPRKVSRGEAWAKMEPNCRTLLTYLFLLLIALPELSLGSIFNQNAGFRVMFTKKGLDYGTYNACKLKMLSGIIVWTLYLVFGPILRDGLKKLNLPDIRDEKKVDIVGKIKYSLSR